MQKVSDPGDWEGFFFKYYGMFVLVLGIAGLVIVGVLLMGATLIHVLQLSVWEPKEDAEAGK